MKKIRHFLKKNYYVFTPFLVALYAVLFLYVNNQHEYKLQVLATPLGASVMLALLLGIIVKLIFRKTELSVLVTSLAVFIALSYGRFLELAKNVSFSIGSFHVGSELFVGCIVAFIGVVLVLILLRFRKKLIPVSKILFFAAIGLVSIQLFQITQFEIESGRMIRVEDTVLIKTDRSRADDSYPDIYYIMPDRYAGQRAFVEQYDFDNSAFLEKLTEKGFFVSENSTTNYPKTFQSLGSTLTMNYLDFLTDQTDGGASKDESIVTPFIENSEVLKFLKDRGYSYVHIGSWWEPTKTNQSADYSFFPRRKEHFGADEFTTGFYNMTIFSELLKRFFQEPSDVSKSPWNNQHRQSALQQFQQLKKIPGLPGPKFVFAHILLPHDPFVFDENCAPISEQVTRKKSHQVNYLNQVACVNQMLEEAIDDILKHSKTPPVIILQSDEGPFPMNSTISRAQAWGEATDTALREKFPIINAYYFPGKKTEEAQLYHTITPVNSFRVLFNTYFNQDYPLLEDRNYVFEDDSNYYKFIDVTTIVQ